MAFKAGDRVVLIGDGWPERMKGQVVRLSEGRRKWVTGSDPAAGYFYDPLTGFEWGVWEDPADEFAAVAFVEPDHLSRTVEGGYGFEGRKIALSVSSGSGGIGFGLSDLAYALGAGEKRPKISAHLSLTPEDAEVLADALREHAAAVRVRQALKNEEVEK